MAHLKEQLIFPTNPVLDSSIPDIPNKYVAIFITAEEARDAVRKSQKAIYARWNEICEDVWLQIFAKNQSESMEEARRIWDRQINPETLFQMFWVIVQGDDKHYHEWLERTQQAFDARSGSVIFIIFTIAILPSNLFMRLARRVPFLEVVRHYTEAMTLVREYGHSGKLLQVGASFLRVI